MKNTVITIIVSLISIILIVLMLMLPKSSFSDNENRYLEKFPTLSFSDLFNGSYTESLKNYTTDHFPFREQFISLKTSFLKLIGQKEINNIYIGEDNYLIEKYSTPQNKDRIINILNKFATLVGDAEIDFMLVPTSIVINKDKLPKYVSKSSELDDINYYYSNLNFNNIDVYNALIEGNKNYPMFYKYDHHWTTYGAYYSYVEYCKKNNIKYLNIYEFESKKLANDFKGTIYSKLNDFNISGEDMYVLSRKNDLTVKYVYSSRVTNTLFEDKYLDKKDKYSYFLDNNHPLITITNNDINNNKKLLVIKDSYANSFIPFLTNHYKEIHVIDPRFYNLSIANYLKENDIDKILILYNINTIDSDTGIISIH